MSRINPQWFDNPTTPQISPVPDREDFINKMRVLLNAKGLSIRGEKIFEAGDVIRKQKITQLLRKCDHGTIKGTGIGRTKYYMAVVDRSDSRRHPGTTFIVNENCGGGILKGQFPDFEQKPHIVILPMADINGINAASFSCIGINPRTYGLGVEGEIKLSKEQYEALVAHADKQFPGKGLKQLLLGNPGGN